MDSFCGALMASAGANAVNFNKGGIGNDGTIFWGENLKKNLKSWDSRAQLRKNLRSRVKKIKPGVAYSLLTSDVNEETVVITYTVQHLMSIF